MSIPPPTTSFRSRGRLNGVLRQDALGRRQTTQGTPAANGSTELDTNAYEALYYRARLILGDSFPRPAR
ncbi:MAG TPA: hypothetical protein VII45_10770 [Solirubrobacterales bacterium]